jgi:FdhD protein
MSMTAKKQKGIQPTTYVVYRGDEPDLEEKAVIEEGLVCIYVNGAELATFMCTPHNLEELAFGFLRSEGFIQSLDDIRLLTISVAERCVDIWLRDTDFTPPTRRIVTSGCGGGVTFDDLSARQERLHSEVTIQPHEIRELMQKLHQASELYNEVRGVHTSALSDGRQLLLVAQDVGRHNTIDRLWGQAMQKGITTKNRVLLASGRISSEMLNKAAKMEIPIVISRTSPTSLSIELGRAWNITIVGYARGRNFRVYSVPERIVTPARSSKLQRDKTDVKSGKQRQTM